MSRHAFRSFQYVEWDGTLENDLDPDDLIESLAEDILRNSNVDLSLQRAFRWGNGMSGQGLNDLIERLRNQRQELLDNFEFGSPIDQIRERLDDIVHREQDAIESRQEALSSQSDLDQDDKVRLGEYLSRKTRALDSLPPQTAQRIGGLRDYDFVDRQAGQDFADLVEQLQKQVADALFNNLMGGVPQPGDGSLEEMQEFLKDLNEAFEQEARGEQPDMDRLNNKWAQQLGGRANSMNEIGERMRQRMEAAQSLMSMLSPEQRAQLQSMMLNAIQASGLADQMAQLMAHLGPLSPADLRQSPDHGNEGLPLDIAMQVVQQASRMDQLESQLRGIRRPIDLKGLDPDLVEEVLGDNDQDWLNQWSNVEERLVDAGLVTKGRRGLELTPRAVRKIGEKALEDIYSSLRKSGFGEHDLQRYGSSGELVETSRPWTHGDPFVLDLPRTVMNAVSRNGPGTPVRLDPSHFEVHDHESRTSTATMLLIDMSRSMIHNGCWDAAKRSALALDTLIRSKFPRDLLGLIGFSATAHPLEMRDLPTLEWNEYAFGTNLQHALELAREQLRPERGKNRQIIVITDGEPTAHIEDGEVFFQYPPTQRTIEATLREVVRCTREDITINTFLLESNPHMQWFLEDLMRINKGRVIASSPNRLGNYVLRDFLKGRTAMRGTGNPYQPWS